MKEGAEGGARGRTEQGTFLSVAGRGEAELVVKRSRFIGWAAPAPDEAAALALVAEARSRYPDATHHCYAYRAGWPSRVVRCSDDGEPAGTAGRPMLEVVERAGLENVAVVVTRYFGGTLLGAAGLVRAYMEATQLALRAAGNSTYGPHLQIAVPVPYGAWGRVQHLLADLADEVRADYQDQVYVTAWVPAHSWAEVAAQLREALAQAEPQVVAAGLRPLRHR